MMTEKQHLGDTPPPVPADTRVPDSSRASGRFLYGLRRKFLQTLIRPEPTSPLPPADLVRKILVVQQERLGDLILAEPALRGLRIKYSHAERVLFAPVYAADLFAGSGWGACVDVSQWERLAGEADTFDLVIDLTGRLEIEWARRLKRAGFRNRIGFDRGGRGVFHTHPVPYPEIDVPTREMYLRITGLLDALPVDAVPRLPRGADRMKRGRDAWKGKGVKQPVVFMPGAHYPAQRWPLEKFHGVGKILLREGLDVAVICGPGEEGIGGALAHALNVPVVAAPPMRVFMDLLATASVAVCNNTGPLHLACALQVPTVSTMGPTVPWRWWPESDKECIVFRGGSNEVHGNLEQIDPDEVALAVLHLLENWRT